MELTTYFDCMSRTLNHQRAAALSLVEGPMVAGTKIMQTSLDIAQCWNGLSQPVAKTPVDAPQPAKKRVPPPKPTLVTVKPAGGKPVSLAGEPEKIGKTATTPKAKQAEAPVAKVAQQAPRHTDLTIIAGIGPKLAVVLAELGVTSVEDIANWSKADVDNIDKQLGNFQGRAKRGNWVVKAKALIEESAQGDGEAK